MRTLSGANIRAEIDGKKGYILFRNDIYLLTENEILNINNI